MELRHLRYFVAVAEELNFRRAAERMHVAQPSLSKQIKDLEYELSATLLERNTSHVSLTDAGKVFLNEAHELLKRAEHATVLVRETAAGRHGTLTIGNIAALSMSVVPEGLAAFRKQFPEVDVTLVEARSPTEHFAALQSGKIQIGLTGSVNANLPPEFESILVLECPIYIFLAAGHRLARKSSLLVSHLKGEPLLAIVQANGTSLHSEICRQFYIDRGIKPSPIKLVDGLESLIAMIAGNLGVSFLPGALSLSRKSGIVRKLIRDDLPDNQFQLYAVWRKEDTSQLVHNFIDVLRTLKRSKK
ncbi:MAG TPA: LysR substrate-binding domain-containing protein [Opitutaceae bacterium]|nr:LysR substrate-binding domain-containing protein [Opitutaceae bacterium]